LQSPQSNLSINAVSQTPAEVAQQVARESYGRLVAWLAWQWRDIAAAEDALAEAFAKALSLWGERGVPQHPEAWLLATAKSELLMDARHRRVQDDPVVRATLEIDDLAEVGEPVIPDYRLRLMFVCTHPAIDPTMRCALMLQTVLGLDAARIARAFLISPEAMSKRLVRTKSKIAQAGVRFEVPEQKELAARADAVLEAIYGAYSLEPGYSHSDNVPSLAQEAMFLSDLMCALIPEHAEAHGLAALLSFCESRRDARRDAQGRLVPFEKQNVDVWDAKLIQRGNECLQRAIALASPGAYQYEAAIQAAHCQRAVTGNTPWSAIVRLYENLLKVGPSAGAQVGHALAVAHANNSPEDGLKLLDAMDTDFFHDYASWWAARAHLFSKSESWVSAVDAYERAKALTADPLQKDFLEARIIDCSRAQ
jgi:RNA polymerase sigma-70 factor, ECF subfamily